MPDMTPVNHNSPLWKAWLAYHKTEAYTNTRYWAQRQDHVDGSLWAAFVAGFEAKGSDQTLRSQITGGGGQAEKDTPA